MKTVQEWINKFNKTFGLDIWVNDVNNDEGTAKLDVETSTGVIVGTIELRRSEGVWRFSSILAPFGGEAWSKLTSM